MVRSGAGYSGEVPMTMCAPKSAMRFILADVNSHLNMPGLPRIAGIAACLFFSALCCLAEDNHRVSFTVSKRTIAQPTERMATGDEKGRVQTLFVVIENLSSHALPEGS